MEKDPKMMNAGSPEKVSVPFLLIFLINLSFCGALKGQLVVDPNPNAQQLIDDVLTGDGVQVTNVTMSSGAPLQAGFFDATDANLLSIDSGVVMSTGAATGAIGPNDDPNHTSYSNSPPATNDPDLVQANGGTSVHDEVIIEFDFVPTGDTIRFDYIFGSEEYMDWVWEGYNDVFGFFISGPGINGPYSNNAENIATIPTTGQPVSIDSVNANVNTPFYIDNGDADNGTPPPPYSTDPSYIQFDGHTVVLTAKRAVQCDSTYHLKLAIGDGGDGSLDSGVLLRANSLTSKEVTIDLDFGFGPGGGTIWEGSSLDLEVSREDTTDADTILLESGGMAIQGTDYNNLPDTLFFQPGQGDITLTLNAYNDNITEGSESVTLDFIYRNSASSCAIWDTTEAEFYIEDAPTLQMNAMGDTTIGLCSDSIELWATADTGCYHYDWQWGPGLPDGDSVVTVAPDTTTTYWVSVSDTCALGNPTDSITVTVPPYDPIDVHSSGDTSIVCPDDSAKITLDSISGSTANTIFWWEQLGTDSSYKVSPVTTTTYTPIAVDTCTSDTAIGAVQIIRPFSPLQIEASPDTSVCTGSQVELGIESVNGGVGDRNLHWDPDSLIESSPTVQVGMNEGNYSYTVTVTDSCGAISKDSMIVNAMRPEADFSYQAEVLEVEEPIRFSSTSQGASYHFWEFDNGQFASTTDTTITYSQPGTYEVALSVNDQLGCADSVSKLLDIEPPFSIYVPNAFTPDGDGINDVFQVKMRDGSRSYHLRIFDRWGKLVFESKDPEEGWDGRIDGEPAPVGAYVYELEVKGPGGTNRSEEGHVTLIR